MEGVRGEGVGRGGKARVGGRPERSFRRPPGIMIMMAEGDIGQVDPEADREALKLSLTGKPVEAPG
jgi:hypothetical protein